VFIYGNKCIDFPGFAKATKFLKFQSIYTHGLTINPVDNKK